MIPPDVSDNKLEDDYQELEQYLTDLSYGDLYAKRHLRTLRALHSSRDAYKEEAKELNFLLNRRKARRKDENTRTS